MRLDPVAKEIVLDNVRTALPNRWRDQVRELGLLGDVSLSTYLAETDLDPEDLYRNGHTFTELRRAAGLLDP